MTNITLTSTMTVKLIDSMASDIHVTRAAQVSARGENNPETETPRLINVLMKERHGSPFEHSVFTFFVKAPIFVFREFQRHRIASYNEMSGRYTKLEPLFYSPDSTRLLVNVGSSMRPEFDAGTEAQREMIRGGDFALFQELWNEYEERRDAGIANEVARTVLPVAIYSQMYVTLNARALMNFLSLRVDSPDSTYRSRPQYEIQVVAEKMEVAFAEKMPHTHAAFVANGRVAP